ncbi:MAG: hypothetical protein IJT05_03650 [Lachnospiraceae bacterium]|nr:hypothetical protein [Lachnospiraceae bacterium]
MKTLYIHIGSPKTGTSSLQTFFGKNQSALYEDGVIFRRMPFPKYLWEVPDLSDPKRLKYHDYASGAASADRNGMFLLGSQKDGMQGENEARRKQGFALLLSWFREKDNILLTDEVLWRGIDVWGPETAAFAKQNNITVKIIVYLRRQLEYLDSLYRQDVKLFLMRMSYREYAEHPLLKEDYLAADYRKPLEKLSKLFGRENLIVRVYDMKQWKRENKTIFDDFLGTMGLTFSSRYTVPKNDLNPSITHDTTELFRTLNDVIDVPDERTHHLSYRYRMAGYSVAALQEKGPRLSYLSREEQEEVLRKYREANRAVAREYLGREELFSEELPETQKWENDPKRRQEDMVLFFGEVYRRLHKELGEVGEECRRIQKRSLGMRLRRLFRRD